jgi:hypothetical protein
VRDLALQGDNRSMTRPKGTSYGNLRLWLGRMRFEFRDLASGGCIHHVI